MDTIYWSHSLMMNWTLIVINVLLITCHLNTVIICNNFISCCNMSLSLLNHFICLINLYDYMSARITCQSQMLLNFIIIIIDSRTVLISRIFIDFYDRKWIVKSFGIWSLLVHWFCCLLNNQQAVHDEIVNSIYSNKLDFSDFQGVS